MDLPTRRLVAASLRASARALLSAELREDEHPDTDFSKYVKACLARFNQQHDYPAGDWTGVERLCYELAKAAPAASVERIDGGWRYIAPDPTDPEMAVVVACHTVSHNDRWTLSTTIYTTPDLVITNDLRSHRDHWTRAFLWEMDTARLMGDAAAIQRMQHRLLASRALAAKAKKMLPSVVTAFKNLYQREPELNGLSVGVSEAPVLPGKIGRHEGPKDEVPYSILTVHPNALKDPEYTNIVIKHELIHYVLAEEETKNSHGPKFQDLAAELRLPRQYRD